MILNIFLTMQHCIYDLKILMTFVSVIQKVSKYATLSEMLLKVCGFITL